MLFQSIVLQTCPWRRKSSPLKNEHVDPSWLENEQIKYLSRYYRFESLIPWPLTGTSVPAAADCQHHLRSTAGIRENKASLADHGPPSLWVSQKMPPGTVRFRNIPTSCTNVGTVLSPPWAKGYSRPFPGYLTRDLSNRKRWNSEAPLPKVFLNLL